MHLDKQDVELAVRDATLTIRHTLEENLAALDEIKEVLAEIESALGFLVKRERERAESDVSTRM